MYNPYTILGINKNATHDEVKEAFRRKAKETHPDMFGGSKEAEERFKQVLTAYNILSDPISRREYDSSQFDDTKWEGYWKNYYEKDWTCPVCGTEGNSGIYCVTCGTSDFFRARKEYEKIKYKRREQEKEAERIRKEKEEADRKRKEEAERKRREKEAAERKRREQEELLNKLKLYGVYDEYNLKVMQVRAGSKEEAIHIARTQLGKEEVLSAKVLDQVNSSQRDTGEREVRNKLIDCMKCTYRRGLMSNTCTHPAVGKRAHTVEDVLEYNGIVHTAWCPLKKDSNWKKFMK